jgi:hypothetical protein
MILKCWIGSPSIPSSDVNQGAQDACDMVCPASHDSVKNRVTIRSIPCALFSVDFVNLGSNAHKCVDGKSDVFFGHHSS